MPAVIRSNVSDILLLLRQRIADITDLNINRIIITQLDPEDVPHYAGVKEVLLQVMQEDRTGSISDGSSRVDDRRTRTIQVVCRSRLYLDRDIQDLDRLTNATLGFLAFEDSVYDAVCEFFATDSDDNVLTSAGMKTHSITKPSRERADPNWVYSTLTLHFEYTRDLDQTRAYGF